MSVDEPIRRVVVLHSSEDARQQQELLSHLLSTNLQFATVWSEDDVTAGADKEQALLAAIDSADVALLLLSSSFLAHWTQSRRHLLDQLLARTAEGLVVVPIIARACAWMDHPELGRLAGFPLNGSLAGLPKPRRDAALVQMSGAVNRILRSRKNTLVNLSSKAVLDAAARHLRQHSPASPSMLPNKSVTGTLSAPAPSPPQRPDKGAPSVSGSHRQRAKPSFCLIQSLGANKHPMRLYFRRDISIGRALDNDVAIDDERISRHHARIFWTGLLWSIVDRGSRTGVVLDGQPVIDGASPLVSGATIQLGGTSLRFRVQDHFSTPDEVGQGEERLFSAALESDNALPDHNYLVAVIKNAVENVRRDKAPALLLFAASIIDAVRTHADALVLSIAAYVRPLLPTGSFLARLRDDVLAAVVWVVDEAELEALRTSARCLAPDILSITVASVPILSRDRPHSLIQSAEALLRDTRPTYDSA